MRSPVILIAGAFLSGVCVSEAVPPFFYGAVHIFLIAGIVCSLLSVLAIKKEKAFLIFLAAGVFFFGALRWQWHFSPEEGDISGYISPSQKVLVEGVISGFPVESGGKTSFCLDTVKILRGKKEKKTSGKILVRCFWHEGDNAGPGDVVTVGGVLRKAEGARNPAGFDWRGYLSKKGIKGILYSGRSDPMITTGETRVLSGAVNRRLYDLRRKADASLRKYFSGDELSSLEAMLLGIRTELSPSAKKDFIRTGTMHVLAVSGLHTTMVAMMAVFVMRAFFFPRWGYLAAAVIVVNAYAFMTGAAPSAIRAASMCSVCMFSKAFERDADIRSVLALAALVMVFIDPGSVFDPGFIMSYLAVIAIVVFYPPVQRVLPPGRIGSSVGISFVVWVSMIPVIAGYFLTITPVVFLSNIAAVSGFSVLLVLGCVFVLAASTPFAQFLCPVLSVVLSKITGFYLWLIHFFASIPYGNFGIRPIPDVFCALYYVYLFFLAFLVKGAKEKALGLFIAFIVLSNFLVWREIIPCAGRGIELIFFDVGKGDSSLIRSVGGETILIDGGSGEKSGYDRGNEVLVPALRSMGIRKIDTVFISHAHEDHFGGLLSLIDEFDIGGFITSHADIPEESRSAYRELQNKAAGNGIKWSFVKSGDVIRYEHLKFNVLNPPDGSGFSGNDSSLVLRMETVSGNSVLFTGDAGCAAMKSAMRYADRLRADIVKVPHHGGNTGDALVAGMFFEKVTPGAAVLSRAHDQPLSSGTMKAFADKTAVYDTSMCGAVMIAERENYFFINELN